MASIFQRLISFFMSVLAFFGITFGSQTKPPAETVDTVAAYDLRNGEVRFSFKSNPTTGYNWYVTQNGNSVAQTEDVYVSDAQGNVGGAGGTQYYTFNAVSPGKTTITFRYERSWETDPPVYTYIAQITVNGDLSVSLDSFKAV